MQRLKLILQGILLCQSLIITELQAMDMARVETGVDKASAEFKVTGQGVLVAVMDRGIDWQNDDFRNQDGSTRIEYIYDLTDDRGAKAPLNTYGMGTIYTKSDINQAIASKAPLASERLNRRPPDLHCGRVAGR